MSGSFVGSVYFYRLTMWYPQNGKYWCFQFRILSLKTGIISSPILTFQFAIWTKYTSSRRICLSVFIVHQPHFYWQWHTYLPWAPFHLCYSLIVLFILIFTFWVSAAWIAYLFVYIRNGVYAYCDSIAVCVCVSQWTCVDMSHTW